MIGIGVSSFSHFGGVNFQNAHNFEEYVRILNEDRLPLLRAVSLTPKQRLIREMVLQLKTGTLDTGYFSKKFGVDVWNEFRPVYEGLEEKDLMDVGVAAHITAAAEGGPRFDPSLTRQQRSSAENGIWLCQTHAKLVDSDSPRFTVELLRQWKAEAEEHTATFLPLVSGRRPAPSIWLSPHPMGQRPSCRSRTPASRALAGRRNSPS